ncbi:peptide-methionine (R)-S-oxide reductase [Candidatus Poribacteria bacterium]|nr:peptide-methionine (R)-S-oxide reductase [Candidatus Poribacteria bacterium]MDP6596040.1 peptide-methionine (R)-S-oxide reductase MsrB [Candidatus Poribacteria bacterium]MDP6747840.1 peptide-methionine (R)-S-oxide reductase MsrB [Candidatus Poribacteria bacterium]MDP6997873.1 peptide-methionine (R)-S-oxide reductase MsrB [Candidatus Poribacteria bacterium]
MSQAEKSKEKIQLSEKEWKERLTPEQYHILRQKGTERPFTNEMKELGDGTFACAGCGNQLFDSETKFESGCGWPSFYQTLEADNIQTADDNSLFMRRTEVLCAQCDGHLGHVFDDGPRPTGLRYCINGAVIDFVSVEDEEESD